MDYKIIAEGTMAPKVTCKGTFVNPITGEESEFEVSCAVNKEQVEDILKFGINTEDCIKSAVKHEFESRNLIKKYETIESYAGENDYVELTVDGFNEIGKEIVYIVNKSTSPKIVIGTGLAIFMEEVIGRDSHLSHDFLDPFYKMNTIQIDGKDVDVMIYAYLPFNERKCLVYDEDNPKTCRLIKYNFNIQL